MIVTHKPRQKLSLRLTVATLIYSLLITILVTALQLVMYYQDAKKDARNELESIQETYRKNFVESLWNVDNSRTQSTLDALASIQHFGYISLMTEDHQLFERNSHEQGNAFYTNDLDLIYSEGDQRVSVGKLHLELTRTNVFSELISSSRKIAITSLTTLLLGSLAVLFLFQHWVSKHLEKMADFTEILDLAHLDKRLHLDRQEPKVKDELSTVVDAINGMIERLQDDLTQKEVIQNELLQHKQLLEEKIQERTKDLLEKTQLLEAQSQTLEHQNRELDAYAHSVAHDLKTPLTTLIGLTSLLASPQLHLPQEKVQESLLTLHKNSKKMASIIDALLTLASVRRSENLPLLQIDARTLALEACNRLSEFSQQHHATISFLGNWAPAFGHEQWVEEVWVNYISNAIKYGGDSPTIEIGAEPVSHTHIKFWVRDHGKGIPEALQKDLFLQFSRLAPQDSEGHGLGLSIVKRIITRLNGDVGYENAQGGGSQFWFTLPIAVNKLHDE